MYILQPNYANSRLFCGCGKDAYADDDKNYQVKIQFQQPLKNNFQRYYLQQLTKLTTSEKSKTNKMIYKNNF